MSDSSSNHVMSEISNRAIILLSGNLAVSFGAPFSPKPGFVRELDPVRIPVMFGLESNLSGKQTALMSGSLRYLLHSRSHSCPGTRSWFHPDLVRILNFACLSPNTFCPGNDLPRVRDFHAPPNAVHSSARGSQLVLVRESGRVGVRVFNPVHFLFDALLSGNQVAFQTRIFATFSNDCRNLVREFHSTRLIAKYRLYIDLRLAALDNIFARQKGLPPGHSISSS